LPALLLQARSLHVTKSRRRLLARAESDHQLHAIEHSDPLDLCFASRPIRAEGLASGRDDISLTPPAETFDFGGSLIMYHATVGAFRTYCPSVMACTAAYFFDRATA